MWLGLYKDWFVLVAFQGLGAGREGCAGDSGAGREEWL